MRFFVIAIFIAFSNCVLAESAPPNSNEIEVVNNKNWTQYAQFLLEPIAKIISTGRLEIVVTNDPIGQPSLDFQTKKVLENGLGIYNFSRTTMADQKMFTNQGSLFLSSSVNDFSLMMLTPESLRDWLYSLKFTEDNDKRSDGFKIHTSINRCREVHVDNVYDEIFSAPIAFKDFYIGQEGKDDFEEVEVGKKLLLIPQSLKKIDADATSQQLDLYNKSQIIKTFTESSCEIALGGEIPKKISPLKKIVFNSAQARINALKKEVIIIKRNPKVSFADIGFELVAIETETKIPLVKLIYNSKIDFVRAVFYYWQEVVINGEPVLLLDGLLSVDKEGRLFFEANLEEAFLSYNNKCLEAKFNTLCAAQAVGGK